MPCASTLPASLLDRPARPALLEIDDLRGRFLAPTQDEEVRRLQGQQLDRELAWEGYAAEADEQFAGIVRHATSVNRCTAEARGDR